MKSVYIFIACVLGLVIGLGSVFLSSKNISLPSIPYLPSIPSHPNLPSQNPVNLPQAHNAFGFNILTLINKEEQQKNIFISPSSIALALSMIYNGAGGETRKVIQQALRLQNLDISTVNQESLGLLQALNNPDSDVELSVANSMWMRQEIAFKKDFIETIGTYYKAKISSLDFNSPAAPATINAWVSENTKGKIPIIVDSISSDLVMFLINAVYFKGTWTTAFDKQQTKEKVFNGISGQKQHPFMQRHETLPYLETDDLQSVSLPYGKNKRFSMLVFLPKQLNSFIDNLSLEQWNEWMKQYQEMEQGN